LLALIAMMGLYWNTLITRVPYYPSNQLVWEAVAKLLPNQQPCRVLEIGSGLGGFSRYISKYHAQVQCLGLETAPIPCLASMVLSKLERANCSFQRKNYENEDFSQYDLIFAFLSPAAMPSLFVKAAQELHPKAQIISYMFAWPQEALPNLQTIQLANGESLYVYSTSRINKHVTGAL
jgi:SAM-dependent methyltransferase